MPRQPPHFKVRTSIQNHPRTTALWADDGLLAMYVRAGVHAIERFADRTGDSFVVSSAVLCDIAGVRAGGVANARRRLGRLEASGMLAVGQEGAGWRLTLRNFSKKQGFKTENGAEMGSSASASASASAIEEQEAPDGAPGDWFEPYRSWLRILTPKAPGNERWLRDNVVRIEERVVAKLGVGASRRKQNAEMKSAILGEWQTRRWNGKTKLSAQERAQDELRAARLRGPQKPEEPLEDWQEDWIHGRH